MRRGSALLRALVLVTSAHAATFLKQAGANVSIEKIALKTRQARKTPRSTRLLRKDDNKTSVKFPSSEMSPSCMKFTGGTCLVQGCADWRGGADCENGRCFCPESMCAGSDGKCHKQAYKTLLKNFMIRNVRWPDHYMYVSGFGYNIFVATMTDSASKFTLRQFPNKKDVLLASERWPDHVVHVQEVDNCDDTGLLDLKHQQSTSSNQNSSGLPHFNVDCGTHGCFVRQGKRQSDSGCMTYEPVSQGLESMLVGTHMSAPTAALKLKASPVGDYVMIDSADHPGRYFYVGRTGWTVMTYRGDPGTGGYWTFDPPLPSDMKLPKFEGRRCSSDCG